MFKLIKKSNRLIRINNSEFHRHFCHFTKPTNNISLKPNVIQKPCMLHFLRSYCNKQADDTGQLLKVDFESIANGDEDVLHRLKVIMLEIEVMRQEGKCVPMFDCMKEDHWKELLKLQSITGRRKYLEFLFKVSKKKENEKLKKEEQRLIREERLKEKPKIETFEEFVQTYDLQHNNIFLRFYDTTINQLYNSYLIKAIQFGQKLVVDCGYDSKMTDRENKNCSKQLMLLFSENRIHEDPYDIHFCNTNPNSTLVRRLHKYIPTMYEEWFPMNIHQCSYLDLFPKDKLVYLTPHCREELTEYDHDAVYIIGAIVDKINNEPLSMAKAKKEKIRMAKLPLDKYLQWTGGSGKSLTLNQMISILLDVKRTGDWAYALRHVPRRKLVDYNANETVPETTDNVRPNKYQKRTSWSPSYNTKLEGLSYNSKDSVNQNKTAYMKANERRKRLINTRSILYDE